MKPKFRSHIGIFTTFIALTAGSGLFSASASAATWVGNTDATLANGLNWDTTPAAPASGESWNFAAAGTAGSVVANDLATSTAFEVAGITFNASAPGYVIDSSHAGTFSLTGNILTTATTSAITIGSNIAVSGARQVNLNGSKDILLTGNISGNGTLTQTAGGTGAKSVAFSGDNSGFSGAFVQNNDGNNRTAFNASTAGSAAATWTFNRNVNGGTALSFTSGETIHFGSISGGGYIRANTVGTITVSVGALNTDTTLSGYFQQSNATTDLALTKVGTGIFTLSNTNSIEGATNVNGGTLNVTGNLANSPVTVNSTATLQVNTGSGKALNSLTVNPGGTAKVAAVSSVTNSLSVVGAGATLDLVNGAAGTVAVFGTGGLTLGGASGSDTAQLKIEVGGSADGITVANGLTVDAGGASINVTNLGLSAGQSYPLITFASGGGAGFATGSGTTVGALTLANPNLSFGISGELEVTSNAVYLNTSGAIAPNEAYWSGANGSNWTDTSGSNANFTTSATGGAFLNVLPGSNTQVFFNNNSPSNLTNALGANFSIYGLTYRGTSAAVSTSGSDTLTIGGGGITIESGNAGAALSMANLVIDQDQYWTNDSSNPLVVAADSVSGSGRLLTLTGSGGVELGGTSLSVLGIEVATPLDLKGTSVTAGLFDSAGDITNSGTTDAVIHAINDFDGVLSGTISDNGSGSSISIDKSGSSVLELSGANSYAGSTSVSAGTLRAGGDNAFSTGAVNLTSGAATLDLNGHAIANALNNNGATGSVITNLSATEATVVSGFNDAGSAGYVISDFTVNGTGDIRWDGAIKRTNTTGTMTKSGTNTLIINEDNDVSPLGGMNLVVADGTLFLGRTTALCFQDLTINGGTLKMDPDYQVSAGANVWQGTFSNVAVMNGGVWDLNDTGTNGISNRVKRITGAGGTITNSGTGESMLVLAARDTATPAWAGNITDGNHGGTVSLTIQWGGSVNQVMQFSGSHTYSGNTYIRENVMQAGAANVFSPNSHFIIPNHNVGGKLDLNGFDNTIGSLASDEPDSQVLLGSATLTTGGTDDDTTFVGVISGTGGLVKVGAGNLTLTGSNSFTGDTTVNEGVLTVDGDAIADAGRLVINGGQVDPGGAAEVVDTLYFGANQQASGTWGATGSGATHIDDIHFTGTGVVSVTSGPAGYDNWAASHAGGQTAGLDWDGDGVPNGVEYFMNAPSGFTANPGVVSNKVSWPNGGNIDSSAYGVEFVVQFSSDLTAWSIVDAEDPNLNNTPGAVEYTLPTGSGKLFVRLVVTPN